MTELHLTSLHLPSAPQRPACVIAGPCSAETEQQVLTTARDLAACGCRIFRAGIWKPRTKPGGFEGVGEVALPWLQQVKAQTGMLTATEVATPEHVALCLKHGIDVLWVGARTVANPFAMQALADSLRGVDVPVLVKNPVNPDLELWIGALQRLAWGPSCVVSRAMERKHIAICPCGKSQSSCAAVFPSYPSFVIPAILVGAATSLRR